MPGCSTDFGRQMEMIYPEEDARIYVPRELSGEKGKMILTVAYRDTDSKLFWHLDDNYIASTTRFHQLAISPSKGFHSITVVDDQGETISRRFLILEKDIGE
jgi:penicillin-binding protein 1C